MVIWFLTITGEISSHDYNWHAQAKKGISPEEYSLHLYVTNLLFFSMYCIRSWSSSQVVKLLIDMFLKFPDERVHACFNNGFAI